MSPGASCDLHHVDREVEDPVRHADAAMSVAKSAVRTGLSPPAGSEAGHDGPMRIGINGSGLIATGAPVGQITEHAAQAEADGFIPLAAQLRSSTPSPPRTMGSQFRASRSEPPWSRPGSDTC